MKTMCEILSAGASESKGNSSPRKCTNTDRISALPDHIRHSITSLLSIKDAIRTSTLSHKWRRTYAYKSSLEFNWHDLIPNPANEAPLGTVLRANVKQFQEKIDKFISCYLGTKIESFKVHCQFGSRHALKINGWVDFAVSKDVEDLDLAFTCDEVLSKRTNDVWEAIDYYDFPTHMLLSGEEPKFIRHLSLRTCTLRSDIFTRRFNALTNLVLSDCKFIGGVEPLAFSSGPNLEFLKLDYCKGLGSLLRFDSLHRLKTLTVTMCDGLKRIEVTNAPSLTFFRCHGDGNIKLTLDVVPNLQEMYVVLDGIDVIESFLKLEREVPHVPFLGIGKPMHNYLRPV